MTQSRFSNLAILHRHKEGTDNLDFTVLAMVLEFVSKRAFWADEISQNLHKEVFFRLKLYK